MTLFVPRLPYQPFSDLGGASGGGASSAPRAGIAPVDVAELFTAAARQVGLAVARKQQALSFDYQGVRPLLLIDGVQMHCALHRLLWGVFDMLENGFLLFTAIVDEAGPESCRVTIIAAGTGQLVEPQQIDGVLRRLELCETAAAGDQPQTQRLARGVCPNTKAPVEFTCTDQNSVLFKTQLLCASSPSTPQPRADAQAERAWLVGADNVALQALTRRLQRLGWATTRFDDCQQALEQWRGLGAHANHPVLVILSESDGGVPLWAEALRVELAATARLVLAVMPGSPLLGEPEALQGFDVRSQPFSPGELVAFTNERTPFPMGPSGDTEPTPLTWDDRPLALIVDDNEVNLIVARGLVEALGYEVRTACDGADALVQCHRFAPQVVLMDVDMPVLDGLSATRQLRDMQRAGKVAPFAIIGATAGGPNASAEECFRAGMDGYLTKPLHLALLRQELRRTTAFRHGVVLA